MKPNLTTFPKIAAVQVFSQNNQFDGQTVCPACVKMIQWKSELEAALRQLVKNDTSGMIIRTPDGAYVKVSELLGDTK